MFYFDDSPREMTSTEIAIVKAALRDYGNKVLRGELSLREAKSKLIVYLLEKGIDYAGSMAKASKHLGIVASNYPILLKHWRETEQQRRNRLAQLNSLRHERDKKKNKSKTKTG